MVKSLVIINTGSKRFSGDTEKAGIYSGGRGREGEWVWGASLKNGSAVKCSCYVCRRCRSSPSTYICLQPSVTPVPGDLTPSSNFLRHQVHIQYTDIHVGKHTHTKIKTFLKRELKVYKVF